MPTSPLAGIYLFEVYWLADTIRRSIDEVFADAPKPPPDGSTYIKADERLHATLYEALSAAARVRALVTEREQRQDQTKRRYEFQVARARWLRDDVLKGLKLKAVLDAKVRHTLEHFDEYIDQTAIRLIDRPVRKAVYLPFDIALGNRRTLRAVLNESAPESLPLRVYYAEERIFVNAGRSIDLVPLKSEAEAIANRLRPLVGNPAESKGGSIVVITPRTFTQP